MKAAGWRWGWVKGGDKEKKLPLTYQTGDNCQIQNPLTEDLSSWKEGRQAHTEMGCSALSQEDRLLRWLCFGGRGKTRLSTAGNWVWAGLDFSQGNPWFKGLLSVSLKPGTTLLSGAAFQLCSFPLPFTRITVHWFTSSPASFLLSYRYFLQLIFYMSNPLLVSASQRMFVNSSKKDNLQGLKILWTLLYHLLKYLHYLTQKKLEWKAASI